MGKRLLAILGVMALGASSAMVGLTMAQGDWTVLGTGLAPGEGYALQVNDGVDRLKFEIANATDGALATFSVYGPNGDRVGFYALDGSTHLAEIAVGAKGVWTVFVYKARASDLLVAVHGEKDAGRFLPASVERREITLGQISSTEAVDHVYSAILDREPVLAGVYLRGTATNLHSELSTGKGVVEVVDQIELSSVGNMIVDSEGKRATMPANLQAGPFNAKITADRMSGTVQLIALYLEDPDFGFDEITPMPADAPASGAPHKHGPPTPPTPPATAGPSRHGKTPMPVYAECGELSAHVPMALSVEHGGMLRLSLGEAKDPAVAVFAPDDSLLGVAVLEEEGDQTMMPLADAGDYVLYARGPGVQVAVMGAEKCGLVELGMAADEVATLSAQGIGPTATNTTFGLDLAPLEFAVRMDTPDSFAMNLRAAFTGPDGEAGAEGSFLELGVFGGAGDLGGLFGAFGGGHERQGPSQGTVNVDGTKMLPGEWSVDIQADTINGTVGILALHYVREDAGN